MSQSVLVLGLGSIGMRHAKNFVHLDCKVAGFDTVQERRKVFKDALGGDTYSDLETALDIGWDLVVVASPNAFHLSQASAAASRGIPLFIEKPLGTDLAEAEAFAAILKQKNVYAHMGSNWKFHPAFKTMKTLIGDGKIGRVCGASVVAGQWLPDWHPWEDYRRMYAARKELGGGAIFDTHELDYLSWLLGPVETFFGIKTSTGSLEIETEDVAGCVMKFSSGAVATILTDYIQRVGHRAYRIYGDKGTMAWSYSSGEIIVDTSKSPASSVIEVHLDDINDAYMDQSRHVLEDLRLGRRAMTGIEQMLTVLQLQTQWHEQHA